MKVIMMPEDKFNNLFERLDEKYFYEHAFMYSEETTETFKKTKRHKMLEGFRYDIQVLKKELECC